MVNTEYLTMLSDKIYYDTKKETILCLGNQNNISKVYPDCYIENSQTFNNMVVCKSYRDIILIDIETQDLKKMQL